MESGLHYNYFRDYEAGTGRYVESDPIGLWGGASTFGYANQQPLEFVDPYGLSATQNYFSCIAQLMSGGDVNCNAADAALDSWGEQAIGATKKAAGAVCDGLKCFAKCTLTRIFGEDIGDAVRKAHVAALTAGLTRDAELLGEVLSDSARRFGPAAARGGRWIGAKGIPVLGELLLIQDGYYIAKCTINCSFKK